MNDQQPRKYDLSKGDKIEITTGQALTVRSVIHNIVYVYERQNPIHISKILRKLAKS